MTPESDSKLEHVASQFRDAFAQHGRSPASVFVPKGRQDLQFKALTRAIGRDGFTVLDYGCGLADLKGYLDERFPDAHYTGVDLVDEFIDDNKRVYPTGTFFKVSGPTEVPGEFDYVTASGIFNILYVPDRDTHRTLVREIVADLFSKCRIALMVSFMTDRVDFQAPNAYHESPDQFVAFCNDSLSARWILDQSYMPYEFTVTVFRDAEIVRPANIYREI